MADSQSTRGKLALQLLFLLILCAAATVIIFAVGLFKPSSGIRRVVFQVNASGGYSRITLKTGEEETTQPVTVTTPWERTLNIPSGTAVYLTASNPTQTGELSCAILLDKRPWKKEKTSAPKDGVACAGIVP